MPNKATKIILEAWNEWLKVSRMLGAGVLNIAQLTSHLWMYTG